MLETEQRLWSLWVQVFFMTTLQYLSFGNTNFNPVVTIKSKSVILFYQKKWVKWVKKINRVFFFSILWGQKGNLFLPYFPRIIFWFRYKMVTNFPFRYKMVTNYRLHKFNTVESDKHILDQNRENTMIRKLEDWKDVKWSSWVA